MENKCKIHIQQKYVDRRKRHKRLLQIIQDSFVKSYMVVAEFAYNGKLKIKKVENKCQK